MAQLETSEAPGLAAGEAVRRAAGAAVPLLGRLLVVSFALVAAFLLTSKGVALVRHYHQIIQTAYDAPGPPEFPLAGDVTVFYTAGEVVASDQRDRLYDPDYFVPKVFETQGFQKGDPRAGNGAWSKFYNPPFFALVLAPLSLFELHTAYLVVVGVNVTAGLLLVYLMGRILRWRQPATLLLALGLFSFTPLYFVFQHAQPSLLLALLLAASYLAMEARASRASGVFLVLAGLKPQWLALPAIVLMQRDRRALLWWAVAGVVVIGLPFLLVGWRGISDYMSIVLDRGGGDISDQNFSAAILSWSGFLRALTGSPQPLLWALLAGVTLVAFLFIVANGDVRLSSAAAIIATLLVVPHSHPQDWVVVAVAAAIALSRDAPLASHLGTCACLVGIYLAGNDWPNESYAVSVGQHATYWITPAAAALLFWFGVQPAFEARLATLRSSAAGRSRWQGLGSVRVQAWQVAGVTFTLGMVLGVGSAIVLLKGNGGAPQFVLGAPALPAPALPQPSLLSGESADASAGWGVNARGSRPEPLSPPDGGAARADATAVEGSGQALAVASGAGSGPGPADPVAAPPDVPAGLEPAVAAPAASAPPVQEVQAVRQAPPSDAGPAVSPQLATSAGLALGPGEAPPMPLELPFTTNSLNASALAGEASVRAEAASQRARALQTSLRGAFDLPAVSNQASLAAIPRLREAVRPASWRALGADVLTASAAGVKGAAYVTHVRNAIAGIPEVSSGGGPAARIASAGNAGSERSQSLADGAAGDPSQLAARASVRAPAGLGAVARRAGRDAASAAGLTRPAAVLVAANPAGHPGIRRGLAGAAASVSGIAASLVAAADGGAAAGALAARRSDIGATLGAIGGSAGKVAGERARLTAAGPSAAKIAKETTRLGARAGSVGRSLAASQPGRLALVPGSRVEALRQAGSALTAIASRLGRAGGSVAGRRADVDEVGRAALGQASAGSVAFASRMGRAAGSVASRAGAVDDGRRIAAQAAAGIAAARRALGSGTKARLAVTSALDQAGRARSAPPPTPAAETPAPVIADRTDCDAVRSTGPRTPGEAGLLQTTCAPTPTPEPPTPQPTATEAARASAPEPPPPPAKCTRVTVVRAPTVSALADGGFRIDAEVGPSEPAGCVEWPAAFGASATLSITSGSAAYQGTWSCSSASNPTAGVPASTHFAFFCTIPSRSGPPSVGDAFSVQVTAYGPGGEVLSVSSQSFPVPAVR